MRAAGSAVAFLLVLSGTALAQRTNGVSAASPLAIGETFTIQSKTLGETRRINVYLPPQYADSPKRAPARVVHAGWRDGGRLLPCCRGWCRYSSGNGTMRPFILVGIENTQRRRDLTGPTQNPEDRKIAPNVSGSAAFRTFIRSELMPAIKARYRTTAETAIIGESLAGLFIVETFFLEPELFDTYIAFDPSLWWNNETGEARGGALPATGKRPHALYLASSMRRIWRGSPISSQDSSRRTHRQIFAGITADAEGNTRYDLPPGCAAGRSLAVPASGAGRRWQLATSVRPATIVVVSGAHRESMDSHTRISLSSSMCCASRRVSTSRLRAVQRFCHTAGRIQVAKSSRAAHGAVLAGARGKAEYNLSPESFQHAPVGLRCVLPSPNGAALAVHAAKGDAFVVTSCLRNAQAAARAAAQLGRSFNVCPAGERWPDGSLRPSLEDWLGAGGSSVIFRARNRQKRSSRSRRSKHAVLT